VKWIGKNNLKNEMDCWKARAQTKLIAKAHVLEKRKAELMD
jgi:hypothetical protein